jgi:hypothetical protein
VIGLRLPAKLELMCSVAAGGQVVPLTAELWCCTNKQVLSLNNVGGVVKQGSLVVGLSEEAWGDAEYGLVPATQSMRLAIAKQLVAEASRSGGNKTL